MEDVVAIAAIFLGLPWIIFHYITKWKTAATLTNGDEALLEELYQLARRLDERMHRVPEQVLDALASHRVHHVVKRLHVPLPFLCMPAYRRETTSGPSSSVPQRFRGGVGFAPCHSRISG